ncbi:MAG: HAD-IIIA family hydrolase [Candidatus Aminicenantales bacterium]
MMKKAVFLDRDGTLNVDAGYPSRYDQLAVYPQSFEAVKKFNREGLLVVIVTNQSGVGRGLLSEDDLKDIHARLNASFIRHDARLDAIYYCPHYVLSEDPRYRKECDCRKPKPGLARQAAADLEIDLTNSYMIGDKTEDVLFGLNIGAVPVLVLTGSGRESLSKLREQNLAPAYIATDILEAADWILDREKRRIR